MLCAEVFALSYARFLLAALAAAGLLVDGGSLVGCSSGLASTPQPMPMSDAGPVVPARTLALLDAPGPRTVLLGETLAFAVRYAESDGRAVVGEPVSFSMVGVAHDSSLSGTTVATDAEGTARGTLLAGRTPAAFRVRASARGAAPATFDVAVGGAGFGAVRAEVRYAGTRTITARFVAIYGGATCADTITVASPDREQPLVEVDSAARFAALPAGVRYAIVARGEGDTGVQQTRGCVDGVLVENGAEAVTVVAMEDVAMTAAGSYDVQLDVDVPTAGDALASAASAALAELAASGGDASYLLDVIALDVADRDPLAADRFATARVGDSLDASLADALGAVGMSPSVALAALAYVGAVGLGTLRVTGTLDLDARGVAAPDGFHGLRVWSLGLGPMPLEVAAIGPTGAPTALAAVGYAPARSVVVVDALDLRLWLGSTTLAVLDAVAAGRGSSGGFAGFLATESGCDAVVRWAALTRPVAAVCSGSCARAACESTVASLVSGLSERLLALDASHDLLHLEGELAGRDADADTRLDVIGPGALSGSWSTPGGSSAELATAALSASRR